MKKQILFLLLLTSVASTYAYWFESTQQADEDLCKEFVAAYAQAIANYKESGQQGSAILDIPNYKQFDICKEIAERKYPKNDTYKIGFAIGKIQPNRSKNIIIIVDPINKN